MRMTHGGDWAAYQVEYGKEPLDFSACISPLGLPEGVRNAAIRALDRADRYPDPRCRQLCAALADFHGLPQGQIVCGNGAAELIDRICRALEPGKALLTAPDFTEYERALRAAGWEPVFYPLREEEDFRLCGNFAESITPEITLVLLCSPNNPTGMTVEKTLLHRVLTACRAAGALLVLDECFLDLTDEPENFELSGELCRWPELVLLKAFTKSYAMAGLRLGYALCGSAAMAEKLRDVGQPWPVSQLAQEAGVAALKAADYVKELRLLTGSERRRMKEELTAMGLRVIPGQANYLLFRCADTALKDKLCRHGILIRDCSDYPGLEPGWYRIAIRTREENDILLTALREVLNRG